MGKIILTKNQEDIIISEYLSGKSQKDSGKKVGVSYKAVQRVLLENNIPVRTQGESRTRFKVNEDFFRQQSKDLAYIIGLFGSDGCVAQNKNLMYIELQRQDKELLEKVNVAIGNERPVKDYCGSKGYENSKLWFYSKAVKEELQKFNIIPNKTYDSRYGFPEILNKEYYFDYIRGLFDGDGSVKETGGSISWQIDTSKKEIAQKIQKILIENDISSNIVEMPKVNISIWRIQVYGQVKCKKIFDLLYQDNDCIYLERKHKHFLELLK